MLKHALFLSYQESIYIIIISIPNQLQILQQKLYKGKTHQNM